MFSIIIKQSVTEAITLMTKDIADKADDVTSQVYEMIQENTAPGDSVMIIGVGNTVRSSSMMFSKEKITIAYTVEKCTKCGMKRKRKFVEGDVLYLQKPQNVILVME